jgi:hypothetical protein
VNETCIAAMFLPILKFRSQLFITYASFDREICWICAIPGVELELRADALFLGDVPCFAACIWWCCYPQEKEENDSQVYKRY